MKKIKWNPRAKDKFSDTALFGSDRNVHVAIEQQCGFELYYAHGFRLVNHPI